VPKEQEPLAGAQEDDLLNPRKLRQEGEQRVDERHRFPQQVDEVPIVLAGVGLAVAVDESL